MLADVAHQLQTVAVWQTHVGQAQVEALRFEQRVCLGHARRGCHRQSHAQQRQLEQFADVGLVIDHQNRRGRLVAPAFGALHAGRPPHRMRKSPPPASPGGATYSRMAALAEHISRAMYRPSPVPPL